MTKLQKKFLLEAAVILFVIVSDLATKYLAFYFVGEGNSMSMLDGIFSITCVNNYGASFGFFEGQKTLLIVLTVVESLFFIAILLIRPNTPWAFRFPMLLILGGAIGNLYDRLVFDCVRDFIQYDFLYSFFGINFAIGNVADIYLVAGVFALVIYIIFGYKEGDFSKVKKMREKAEENA